MLKERIEKYLEENTDRHNTKWLCARDAKLWNDIISVTVFLEDPYPKQRIWHILNDIWEIPKCPVDNIDLKWFDNRYLKYSSQSAKARCPEFNKHRTDVARARRGVIVSERQEYRNAVWKHTKLNWRLYKHKIQNYSWRSRDFHLDHKLSIEYGYINKVDPKLIGHWCNFQILKASENYKKHMKSSITLDALLEAIKSNR